MNILPQYIYQCLTFSPCEGLAVLWVLFVLGVDNMVVLKERSPNFLITWNIMGKDRHKRLDSVYFHCMKLQKWQIFSRWWKGIHVCLWLGFRYWLTEIDTWELWVVMKISYILTVIVATSKGIYIYIKLVRTLHNIYSKWVTFIACKLYLKKEIFKRSYALPRRSDRYWIIKKLH